MTSDEILKSYMDQLALDQQNFRDDLRAMQTRSDERWEAQQTRWEAQQTRWEAQQVRSDERWEAQQTRSDERLNEVKRDIRTTLWSGLAVAAAIFGTITGLLLAFIR